MILQMESMELLKSSSSLSKDYRKHHYYTMLPKPAAWTSLEEPLPSEIPEL